MSKIYLASSWRNPEQPACVDLLRKEGHEVYDFRNPPGLLGFAWDKIDPDWKNWTAQQYISALYSNTAEVNFQSDFGAMEQADTGVLLLPCGRSAHLELGWMVGKGKRTIIVTRDGEEPELMARMADYVCEGVGELLTLLEKGYLRTW